MCWDIVLCYWWARLATQQLEFCLTAKIAALRIKVKESPIVKDCTLEFAHSLRQLFQNKI